MQGMGLVPTEKFPALDHSEEKRASVREWLVSLGVPALFFGIGWAVMTYPGFFWWGFWILTAAAFFFVIDAGRLKGVHVVPRIGLVAIALLSEGLFVYIAFRPAPLNIDAVVLGSGFSTTQGGIQWTPELGQVEITISNPTQRDYSNLNLTFSADGQRIVHIVEESGPKINIYPNDPKHAGPPMFMTMKSKDGEQKIPLIATDDSEVNATIYTLQCDKMPRNSTVRIMAAIGRGSPIVNGELPKQFFAPFSTPEKLIINGDFDDANRPNHIDDLFPSKALMQPQ